MVQSSGKSRGQKLGSGYLIVYGTLMRGGSRHHLLSGSETEFLAEGKIQAELFRLPGADYPGAVPTTKSGRYVHGEIYALKNSAPLLARLDEEEGCDEGLFCRQLVEVIAQGKNLGAWTYFYAKSTAGAELIPNGKFAP